MELLETVYFSSCYFISQYLLLFSILVKVITISDVNDKDKTYFAIFVKKSKFLLSSSYYLSLLLLENLKTNENVGYFLSKYNYFNDNFKYYTNNLYNMIYNEEKKQDQEPSEIEMKDIKTPILSSTEQIESFLDKLD
jgi:hypothetical protein